MQRNLLVLYIVQEEEVDIVKFHLLFLLGLTCISLPCFHLHFLSSQHLSVSQHSSSFSQQSSMFSFTPQASSLQQASVSQHSSSFSQQTSSTSLSLDCSFSSQHSVAQQPFSSSQQFSTPLLLDIFSGSPM